MNGGVRRQVTTGGKVWVNTAREMTKMLRRGPVVKMDNREEGEGETMKQQLQV